MDDLLAQAEAAVEQGDYREALIHLRVAVADNPENGEARYRLALASLKLGDAATAEKELRRARELGFDPSVVVHPSAQALIDLGRSGEALAELRGAEEVAETYSLQGLAYEQLGRNENSLRAFAQALALDDSNEVALLGMARLSNATGDRDAAERYLERARSAYPESLDVALEYGRFLFLTQRSAQATKVFEAALAQPTIGQFTSVRVDFLLWLAEAQLAQSLFDEARETAAALEQLSPDGVRVLYIDARIAFGEGELDLAKERIARVIVEAPEFDQAQTLQAKIYLAQANFAQARQVLSRLSRRAPNDTEVRELLAAANKGVAEQDDGTRRAGRPLSQTDLLVLTGGSKIAEGDLQGAVMFWEQALERKPGNQDLALELLGAYLAAGRLEEVKTLIADTSWVTDFARKRVALISIVVSMREGDQQAAREQAAAAVERFSDDAPLATIRGMVEVQENPSLAKEYFERALALDGTNSTAVINLASLADATGQTPNGIDILQAFIAANPTDAAALEALASKLGKAGDGEEVLRLLREARKVDPDAIRPRLMLAEVLVQIGDSVELEAVARELTTLQPRLVAGHNLLGVALLAQGKLSEGVETFRNALRISPDNVAVLRNLVRAEMAGSNFAQAQLANSRLLALQPQDVEGRRVAAQVALSLEDFDNAGALIDEYEAVASGENAALGLVLRGDLAGGVGDLEQARQLYEQAFEQQPAPTLLERVFNVRKRLGVAGPEAILIDWLEQYPEQQGVRLLLAQHLGGVGDNARAAAEYERILAANPSSLVAWNNLALAYQELGDERALEAAQKAISLAPNFPLVQDTYGWVLIRAGQLEDGISMLDGARELAPDNGDIAYHLAVGLVQAERPEKAREVLEGVLSTVGSFETRAEAERLLEQL